MESFTDTSTHATRRKRALICGVTGQDGSLLARLLLSKGYEVVGTSRDAQLARMANHRALGIAGRVRLVSMAPTDFRSVLQTLKAVAPDEIYNLGGQTSVGLSFSQPVETNESITLAVLNLLEAIRFIGLPMRMYNAGSSECFGECSDGQRVVPANELTPFRPRSPYAVAKASAHWMVANYREAYGLPVCTGILFNHESALRPERFVTQKVVRAAARIARGSREHLVLGNLDVARDWGWAEEHVDAIWRMLQQPVIQEDLVIATGTTHSLRSFVHAAFAHFGLDWQDHVRCDDAMSRPSDIAMSAADPSRACAVLGWRATMHMPEVVGAMARAAASVCAAQAPPAGDGVPADGAGPLTPVSSTVQ